MGSVSYKSDNLFFIEETVNYAEKACADGNKNYARFAFLFSSAAHALKGAQCTVKALGSIPFCIIKIPCSIYFKLGEATPDSYAEYIHHEFPGIGDVACHAVLAFHCFCNIILVPIFGFLSPEGTVIIHKNLFNKYGVKPLEKKLEEKNDVDLDDLKGMDHIKKQVNVRLLNPLKDPERAKKYGAKIENILLHGLPGCGKTHLVSAIKNTIQKTLGMHQVTYHEISSATNGSMYLHGSALLIEGKFKQMEYEISKGYFPIVFIDEVDCVLGKREDSNLSNNTKAMNEELGLYLRWVEKLSGKALIIGATNFPGRIDPALIRPGRIGHHIYVAPPNVQERQQIIQDYLNKFPKDILDEDINAQTLAIHTNDFAACDLKALVECGAKRAFAEDYEKDGDNPPTKINQDMLIQSLKTITPSCPTEKVTEYFIRNRLFINNRIQI